MPIFEYQCNDCKEKYEILHKSLSNPSKVECPKCQSENHAKLFSAFSSNVSSGSDFAPGCASGSCGVPAASSPCSNGMCGL